MIHIPSGEIKQPSLHADTLGFTFVWHGHFLRGIYPESMELAKSYFESGFIDETVEKGLFPKTWISDYENEQFGMIIEHEMISPVLYATDWNSAMLKDAALMVLDIAEIGWRYGYNMVDCHKLNVMFRDNHPIYVDLGSFVLREEGSTGWKPYRNFLESYTYILDIWTHGCGQIAKRMMSPGVCLRTEDYLAYKYPIYRKIPLLMRIENRLSLMINFLAINGHKKFAKSKLQKMSKAFSSFLKIGISQHPRCLMRMVQRLSVEYAATNEVVKSFDCVASPSFNTITCINISDVSILNKLAEHSKVISINEKDCISNKEYQQLKNITSASFPLLNGCVLIRGKFPETRLRSEVVLTRCVVGDHGVFASHNCIVFLERCMTYSSSGMMYIWLTQPNAKLMGLISERFAVERILENGILIVVKNNSVN